MCILCVVQKWSRRVATMLPWLVLPLIGLWSLSQLFPPGFRFEVTSPRVACVLVLVFTVFWYEILMPQLSAWRMRRRARLRERQMFEALEMQKLRKTATRRCRNCLNPYRDQNPGGGKFMCSYCGHVSKRPVLDLPGTGLTNSGIIGDLVGKSGKMWNGKVWSENGWSCSSDWLENGNWGGGSFSGNVNYWDKRGAGFFSGDDQCLAEKSYSGFVMLICNLLGSFFFIIRWLWRKLSKRGDPSLDGEDKGVLPKKGDNGGNFNESRGDKARRKAEEKKQAKIEKELLEEEERKQREEVARLVEERRRQRDEKMQAEKVHSKGSTIDREKDSKKESERKRQERRKERDKGSSKSNSDGEELEKRAAKESEKKQELDKRTETKNTYESIRTQSLDTGHGSRVANTNNFSKGGAGGRYLDRVKGSFLSSSKGFGGSGFFGNGGHAAVIVAPKNNSNGSVDHIQATSNKREVHLNEHVSGKINFNGDDKVTDMSFHRPVVSEPKPRATPKKSWQQLFARPSAVPPSSIVNTISSPYNKPEADFRSSYFFGQAPILHPSDNPIHFGLSSPFNLSPYPSCSMSSGSVSSVIDRNFSHVGELTHECVPDEPELFEDPSYVPDPVSLLGPVSESLDIFPLDQGSGFVAATGSERPRSLPNASVTAEINRPSPIESPVSRVRVAEERQNTSNQFPYAPKAHDLHASPTDVSSNMNEQGTWQMWGTSPLIQDGLGLVGGPASWLLPLGQNKSNQEDAMFPSSHKTMVSSVATHNVVFPGGYSLPRVHLGSYQDCERFNPPGPGLNSSGVWLPKAVCESLPSDGESYIPLHNTHDDVSRNEMAYCSPSKFETSLPFEPVTACCWSNNDWDATGSREKHW